MKVRHNGYIYQGKDSIERAMKRQSDTNGLQQKQLDLIREWARMQLALHQPRTHTVDLSCHDPKKLTVALSEKVSKDIWCSRCSNPWPCRHIESLRMLRDLASYNDVDSLGVIADAMSELPTPERQPGQIDVLL